MSKHTNRIIRAALDLVKPQFRLPLDGEHGIGHWVRVWANAELLCAHYGVDPTVPCWFAFVHDSQRWEEGADPVHGVWAAAQMRKWHKDGGLLITDDELDVVCWAMFAHSSGGRFDRDIRVKICWDADRLDLGRVGIMPDPARLCTAHAQRPEVIEAAYRRSRSHSHKPETRT